jgi:tetratricopeptide (TPR) repeat protein
MEIQRCPVCGWPTPKGRPCPRGCGRLPVDYSPVGGAAPKQPAVAQPEALPERRSARRRARAPSGIGGWLILPIIGLVATLCLSAWSLFWDIIPIIRSDTWAKLTSPSSETYHWLWQPWMLFDAFAMVVMVLAPIVLLVMIFRKHRTAPRYVIIFYVFCIVALAFDAFAGLFVLVGWLHAHAFDSIADTVRLASLRDCGQALALAAIWIPYFRLSKRVKNTFVAPRSAAAVDDPALAAAPARARPIGRRRVGAALVVLIIIVVAGGTVFGLNMYETSASDSTTGVSGGVSGGPSTDSKAAPLMTQAEAAHKASSLDQALALYDQALQADPAYEPAYYGKWNILVEKKDYTRAETVARQATQRFPTSRSAWFDLGFAQEALNDLPGAQASYTTCLKFPAPTAGSGLGADDATVHKRLDLVTYVVSISAPRQAVAGAIDAVNKALARQPQDDAAIKAATSQAGTALDTNLATLEQLTPPAYFAGFQATMLASYRDIKTACSDLAVAVAGKDATAVTGAQKELNDAIDRFNQNDSTGTSLMQSYYTQTAATTADTAR